MMDAEESKTEELEPLFDYSRIQPTHFVDIDDDELDFSPVSASKRKGIPNPSLGNKAESCEVVNLTDAGANEEEDWMPPPPKRPAAPSSLEGDSTIKELRLKKQELASVAQSAEDVVRAAEESARRKISHSGKLTLESEEDQPLKVQDEREKIVISIQDKDGVKPFRMYMDDKFERIFKMYAEKINSNIESLVFCFDGDKISSNETPAGLGLENDDIIEVRQKPR